MQKRVYKYVICINKYLTLQYSSSSMKMIHFVYFFKNLYIFKGKYVPSFAYKIHTMGNSSGINLKGMAIGNGMCDPETMMDYGPYLYNLGLVDENQAKQMNKLSAKIVANIKQGKYWDALVGMDELIIEFNILPYVSLFRNFTGFDFYYNFLISDTPIEFNYFKKYIQR